MAEAEAEPEAEANPVAVAVPEGSSLPVAVPAAVEDQSSPESVAVVSSEAVVSSPELERQEIVRDREERLTRVSGRARGGLRRSAEQGGRAICKATSGLVLFFFAFGLVCETAGDKRCQGVAGGCLCLSRAQVTWALWSVDQRIRQMPRRSSAKDARLIEGVVRDRSAKDDSAPRADRWR